MMTALVFCALMKPNRLPSAATIEGGLDRLAPVAPSAVLGA
jgi:hypothetical protein